MIVLKRFLIAIFLLCTIPATIILINYLKETISQRRDLQALRGERDDLAVKSVALEEQARKRSDELLQKEKQLQSDLQAQTEKNKTLAAERDAAAAEKTAAAKEIETLKAEVAAKTIDLGKFQSAIDGLKTPIGDIKTQLEELKTLKKNNDLLSGEATRLAAELRDATQKLAKAELLLEKAQVEKARLLFEKHKLSQEPAPAKVEELKEPAYPEIPLEGKVVAADNAGGVAVLGIGQDQGVLQGMKFTVSRSGEKIAVLQATRMYPNVTGCTILSREAGKEVQLGDTATSKRNS